MKAYTNQNKINVMKLLHPKSLKMILLMVSLFIKPSHVKFFTTANLSFVSPLVKQSPCLLNKQGVATAFATAYVCNRFLRGESTEVILIPL